MLSETKRWLVCEYKESYKINLILATASALLVWALCIASFILFAKTAFVYGPLIDGIPILTLLIFACIHFRSLQFTSSYLLVCRIFQSVYAIYMLIFSLIVCIKASRYYGNCYIDTRCDQEEVCCNSDYCYDCAWLNKSKAEILIMACTLALVASLLLMFIQIQSWQISRKIARMQQPYSQQPLIPFEQLQDFQTQGVQQEGIQSQIVQQGLIISQSTSNQQETQLQVSNQIQPNPQIQQVGVKNPNKTQPAQQTGADYLQQQ